MSSLKGQFTRIKGSFSEARQLPRLGKIRLGVKVKNAAGKEYPKETPWFVCPDEVADVYGKEPIELDIMLPHEDPEVFFPQKLAMYGTSAGLKCHGNGEQARRLDEKNEWVDRKCPCEFLKTTENPKGACTEQSSLMVLLPKVSMGGCYQITTGSFHSTKTLNSAMDYIRGLAGRLALIPMRLRRVPRITHSEGKPQTHYTLELILDGDLKMIRELRSDIEGVLIPGRYQIEGPIDENKTLDPVDEEDEQIDAAEIANMNEAELGRLQDLLNAKQNTVQGDGLLGSKNANPTTPEILQDKDAPAPPKEPTKTAPSSTNVGKPSGSRSHQENGDADWKVIITAIDMDPDWHALKMDWKAENKVDNVSKLTSGGREHCLKYLRQKIGAAFPY